MSGRQTPFCCEDIANGLALPPGKERIRISNTLGDFLDRGEVVIAKKQNRRQGSRAYSYNLSWRRKGSGVINRKIHKAIYVAGIFSAADIIRLAEARDRSHVTKTIKRLLEQGKIVKVGRRPCASGPGAESLYNIPDRDRYRLEVMK